MRVLLLVVSLVVACLGGLILMAAKSAIHEIEAFVLFVVAAVLFVGAAIVQAIKALPDRRETRKDLVEVTAAIVEAVQALPDRMTKVPRP